MWSLRRRRSSPYVRDDEIVAAHDPIRFRRSRTPDAALQRMRASLHEKNVNGGAILEGFEFGRSDPVVRALKARGRALHAGYVLESLLGSEALAEWFAAERGWWLPDDGLRADRPSREVCAATAGSFYFDPLGGLVLAGELAKLVVRGGAYRYCEGTVADARDMGEAAARAMIGERYLEVDLFICEGPWHPWFHGLVWDWTLVVVDVPRCRVTLLCVTDID